MGDMVRVVTEDGRVLLSNRAFQMEMGSDPKQFCFSALGLEHRCPDCLTKNVLASGKVHKQTRKMNEKIYSVTASPLFSSTGAPLAVIESFRDITDDFKLKQELVRSNIKMQRDLDMARSLQSSMVRHDFNSIRGVRITAGYYPCEAIGGDIYDCFESGGKLVLYVSDVSGHGVMPAMLGVFVLRTVRQICDTGELSPDGILYCLQGQFEELQLDESIYITAFIAVLDVESGDVRYANAALSVPPLLFDGERPAELHMPSQPICRWFENPFFMSRAAHLPAGGRLLLYTDGLAGADSQENMQQTISGLFSKAEFNADGFLRDVRSGVKEQADDLTLLICERKEQKKGQGAES